VEAGFDRRESQGSQGAGSPPASPFGGREGVFFSIGVICGAKAGDARQGEPANPRPPPPERVGTRSWPLQRRGPGVAGGSLPPSSPLRGRGGNRRGVWGAASAPRLPLQGTGGVLPAKAWPPERRRGMQGGGSLRIPARPRLSGASMASSLYRSPPSVV
jgi:hypothetical protein